MALFELVLEGRLFGQQTINRYNYVSSGTPSAASLSFGLFAAFGCLPDGIPPAYPADTVFANTRAVQQGNQSYTQVIVKNVYDLADFYSSPFPTGVIGGNTASECLSPTVAFGLETNQTTRAVRRGMKRIPAVPEGSTGEGGVITTTVLTLLQTLCDSMSESITYDDEGNTITYSPVVVKKLKYTTPSGKSAYKYYPTLTEQLTHIASGIAWSPFTQTRTQRSRQYGKGS